jgi:hypothetical protein
MNKQIDTLSQKEIEAEIRLGGGRKNIEKQHQKGRLTARERIEKLIDPGSRFFELGLWAAFDMYREWGSAPAAGIVCGVGRVSGARHMIIANDATVKAGSFFPMTVKKLLRAQHIALAANLPLIYLVDSAGVFLPLQDEVFPDEDDFGRIFRNNAVISAAGIPQTAAIMGSCVAGGAYLPVMCDRLLMTEGSGLYIAGPSLVKAAIGQDIESEDLGGAKLHALLSGTVDFREEGDLSCLNRLRQLAVNSHRVKTPFSARSDLKTLADIDSSEELYGQFHCRVGQAQGAVILMEPGFSGEFAAASARQFLEDARHQKDVVMVLSNCVEFSADDAAAFAMFGFECRQSGPPVVFLMQHCESVAIRHWCRSFAPTLVLAPFAQNSLEAAARLWIDLLYDPEELPQILEEAIFTLRENIWRSS